MTKIKVYHIQFWNILGDENLEAGEKFKIGDIVTVNNDNRLFIIKDTPLKKNGVLYEENRYFLATIENNVLNSYFEFYEYQLRKYNGTVAKDSPYKLLQELYTHKLNISDELLEKIEFGEIILNEKMSWRDFKELNIERMWLYDFKNKK